MVSYLPFLDSFLNNSFVTFISDISKINANDFQQIVTRSAVKAISITDENLAKAIKKLLEVQ